MAQQQSSRGNNMPLDKTLLKTAIETELKAGGFELTEMTEALATAIANAVIDEITTNALVTPQFKVT